MVVTCSDTLVDKHIQNREGKKSMERTGPAHPCGLLPEARCTSTRALEGAFGRRAC